MKRLNFSALFCLFFRRILVVLSVFEATLLHYKDTDAGSMRLWARRPGPRIHNVFWLGSHGRVSRCRHLVNSTIYTHHLWFCPFAVLYENMRLSTIPEVHDVSQCHQMRTEPRPQGTWTKNFVKLVVWFLRYAGRQTDKQTDIQTHWLQYWSSTGGEVDINPFDVW